MEKSEICRKPTIYSNFKNFNAFEIHKNREKFKLLGRQNKHDHGQPGISRGKCVIRREETLGNKFKTRNRINKFMDFRIFENADDEVIANARFTALHQKNVHKEKKLLESIKEDKFSNRDQTIHELAEFDHDQSVDTAFDEVLDIEYTKNFHFGGGNENLMVKEYAAQNLISTFKSRKLAVLKEKEEALQMTCKLDETYKILLPQLAKFNSMLGNKFTKQNKDYDKIVREMIFESRGEVTNKLQVQELNDDPQKIQYSKLQQDQLKRMVYCSHEQDKPNHVSADNLDDDYLAYDDLKSDKKTFYDTEMKTNLFKKDLIVKNNSSDIEEIEKNYKPIEFSINDDQNMNGRIGQEICKSTNLDQIPKQIQMPETFEQLKNILLKYDFEIQAIIVEKVMQSCHSDLQTSKLLFYLLNYVTAAFDQNPEIGFKILNNLMPKMFDIVKLNPKGTMEYMTKFLKDNYEKYNKNTSNIPSIKVIIIFKIISNLYSSSDFHHPVVTPAVVFISQILTRSHIKSRRDISLGIFLVSIILEFTNLSKRFLPEVFNFIGKLLNLSYSKSTLKCFKNLNLTKLDSSSISSSVDNQHKLNPVDLSSHCIVDLNFEILVINTCLQLIQQFSKILKNVRGSIYIIDKCLSTVKQLVIKNYPEYVNQNYTNTILELQTVRKTKLIKLITKFDKPKALRLFEPKIENICDDKRRQKLSEEKTVRAVMLHKIRRETKGVEREIRKDVNFLNKLKIKQQIKSDMDRKNKVKHIFSEASIQQGELNSLTKKHIKTKF